MPSAAVTSQKSGGDPSLWAVTCLFGDTADGRRLANYRMFRRRLSVPLVTVEMTFGAHPCLLPDDADVLIQVCGEPLWQKERLLNLALAYLPAGCRNVAWLDCDIVFCRDDWAGDLGRLLEQFPVAQLYERALDWPRDGDLGAVRAEAAEGVSHSFAWRWREGVLTDELRRSSGTRIERDCASGLAWAARREVLETHGLYDACIAGAGDRAMDAAMIGRFDDAIHALRMTVPFSKHYLAWARPWHEAVRGRVGCLSGDLLHLWHGDPRQRKHRARHQVLNTHGYDPARDITLDTNGTWRFTPGKPALSAFFCDYFAERAAQELRGRR